MYLKFCCVVADEGSGEPASKKAHSMGNQEDLQRQLLEVQRKADDYKAQLKEKAQEAEVYRKQLNEMTAKTTSPWVERVGKNTHRIAEAYS